MRSAICRTFRKGFIGGRGEMRGREDTKEKRAKTERTKYCVSEARQQCSYGTSLRKGVFSSITSFR